MRSSTPGEALWRQRWLIAGVMVLCLATAVAISAVTPKSYTATTTIFLDTGRNSTDFNLGLQSSQLLIHDYIVLATSRPVLTRVCATAGVYCTPAQKANPESFLAKDVSVNGVNGTSLLAVSGTASTPVAAAALANAEAKALIDQDAAEIDRLFKPTEDSLDAQLATAVTSISAEQTALQALADKQQTQQSSQTVIKVGSVTTVTGSASGTTVSAAIAAHQTELALLQNQYANLFTSRENVDQLKQRESTIATIEEAAVLPGKPSAPDPVRYLLVALLAGPVLGVLLALLLERFNDRLYSAEALAKATGATVAIMVPRRPGKLVGGAYAVAHAALLARNPDTHKLLVAGASERDHAHLVAASLGEAAAQSGQRVLLLQADGAQPTPATDAAETHGPGVANGHDAVAPNGVEAVDPSVSGLTTVSVAGDQAGRAASTALAAARDQYDFAIVAVPSPESSPAALSLARTVDRAILVATAGATRFQDARRAADLLHQAGMEVAAGILLPRRQGKRAQAR